MDIVIRAAILYLFIVFMLRLTGKRTLNEITAFDFVLILLIAETTDNSIIGDDHSIVSTFLAIITFCVLEIILTALKERFKTLDTWMEGKPIIVVQDGKLIKKFAETEKVDEEDVLEAARRYHGIQRLDQIKFAILEKNGGISVIPKQRFSSS